jgi:hypothetical protein
VALSAFHADVLTAEEAEAAGGAEGGMGAGPAGIPPSEDMEGEQVLDWEAEREQRRVNARNQGHEAELDVSLEISDKPPTPLQHTSDRVPWHSSYPLPQRGAVYVRNFLIEMNRSRREGRGPDSESHATGAGILPKRSNRRQGSWSDLHKQQRHGFLCHLGREWVATYRNFSNKETGEPRFTEDERIYRLKAMQHLVADLGVHYARLPNQPDLSETWEFHQRLELPPSQRGRNDVIREFTVIHPNPDLEVEGPGCGGYTANEDLGAWQSHMAWEYGTDWVVGFLAGKKRYVEGPAPALVSLWPIAHLRHHESDKFGEEEDGTRRTQGVTTPSGPVIAPPSIAPPIVATAVPIVPAGTTAAPPTIPTTTVAPTPVATAPSTAPTTQPAGGVSTTTTTGAQLPRERPPTTEERHPKRAATEAAATLQALQLAAGGGPRGPAATMVSEGSQTDQQWAQARAEVQWLWALSQQLQGKAETKTIYTGFREVAKMAQDALEAADAASRRARQERMASVGALPLTELQLPGAPEIIEPSERLEADCQNQVQALAQEILRRGAAAMAAGAASAGQGAQRPEGEVGARASRGATQPGTMLPPPTPTRTNGAPVATTGPPATTTGPQDLGGPPGPTLPTTAMGPEDRRPRGIRPPTGPSVVRKSSSNVEFNAGMSRDDVIIALLGFLSNQFKEPPEVSAEFGEGYAASAEGAERTIAERFAQRILTDENLDVEFSLNQEEAGHRLRGLWRRMRQEEHERQPPYERPGLRQPPLPDPSTWAESEEFLNEQGFEPIELEGEALGEYLADLEEAVWVWWRTTGPATNLPAHQGRLVDPEGPKTGGRWPSNNFLAAQIRTLWALERAERTFAAGVDVSVAW